MPEVIGKFEKPSAENFKTERKIYLVPLLYTIKDAPQEYQEILIRYWDQVEEHLSSLEKKVGKIKKIYFESVSQPGEQGMKIIQALNEKSHQMVKRKCEQGAELQAVEDIDLFVESMDWSNCLRLVAGESTFRKISEMLLAVNEKRYELIAGRINETLEDQEAGALFIREGHSVQFPPAIQVFYVSPPALDEAHRWLRDRMSETSKDHS